MSIKMSVAWFNGVWGSPKELTIEINSRGLKFGDGIFETICILNGKPQLLSDHVNRWSVSASLLEMASPPSVEQLIPLIEEGIKRSSLIRGNAALRINWARGSQNDRSISISKEESDIKNHKFWFELHSHEPCFDPISTMISKYERRNANSQLSHCKTFGYGQSIHAKQEAYNAGFDEALLLSTTGELCCGTTSNVIIKRQGEWLTPPLSSGCLPGIMRQQGLKIGIIKEKSITPNPLEGDEWLLINSLSCRPIRAVNDKQLTITQNPNKLWAFLLDK